MDNDFWFWLSNSNGKFDFHSTWDQIRNKNTEYSWCKLIWDNACAPIMSLCSLLARLNKLDTKERISKWNSNIDLTCCLCLQQTENRDHLFFDYRYSLTLVDNICRKLQINGSNIRDITHLLDHIDNLKLGSLVASNRLMSQLLP